MRACGEAIFRAAAPMGGVTNEVAILHMKTLFINGEASIVDVDPYGRIALQVSRKPSHPFMPGSDLLNRGLFRLGVTIPPPFL